MIHTPSDYEQWLKGDYEPQQTPKRACGRATCGVSMGIHEGLTFGTGKLDDLGYWEFPCEPCARAYEKQHPEERGWPFASNEYYALRRIHQINERYGELVAEWRELVGATPRRDFPPNLFEFLVERIMKLEREAK